MKKCIHSMYKNFSLFLSILFIVISCRGEEVTGPVDPVVRPPVEISTHVDRAVATTGDEITYTVTINYDPAVVIRIPEFGEEIGGFRVLDLGEKGPREVEKRLLLEKWYILKADLVGSYVLPSLILPYVYDGEQGEASTAQIFVEVESVLNKSGGSDDIRDIKSPALIERDLRRLMFLGGLCALAAVSSLAGIIFYVRKRRFRPAVIPAGPAHEIALNQLEQLRKKNLMDAGQVRLYYFELSEIFRQYLENRFSFSAVEQTTEEILRALQGEHRLDHDQRQSARQFLTNTDWVKFAKHTPRAEQIERDTDDAVAFINRTKEEETVMSGRGS